MADFLLQVRSWMNKWPGWVQWITPPIIILFLVGVVVQGVGIPSSVRLQQLIKEQQVMITRLITQSHHLAALLLQLEESWQQEKQHQSISTFDVVAQETQFIQQIIAIVAKANCQLMHWRSLSAEQLTDRQRYHWQLELICSYRSLLLLLNLLFLQITTITLEQLELNQDQDGIRIRLDLARERD